MAANPSRRGRASCLSAPADPLDLCPVGLADFTGTLARVDGLHGGGELMGLLARRQARKAFKQFESARAEHEAFLETCELLCTWKVYFDLDEEFVSVFRSLSDDLDAGEQQWLAVYVGVGYIVKLLSNFGDEAPQMWPRVLSGEAIDAEVVEEHLTFTNAPSYDGEPVSEPTHIYEARVYRKAKGL